MEKLERRMATCDEFRAAIKTIVGSRYSVTRYTDQPQHRRKIEGDPIRYIKITVHKITDQDVENIEMALWILGATADTRITPGGLRGTCLIK